MSEHGKAARRFQTALNARALGVFDVGGCPPAAYTGEILSFTQSGADILGTFLGVRSTGLAELVTGVDAQGVNVLVSLAALLQVNPEQIEGLGLRTVFGASEQMPVGALAYPLASIHMAEALGRIVVNRAGVLRQQLGCPQVQVAFMNEAGGVINGRDQGIVGQETELFSYVLGRYVTTYHGEISSKVALIDDKGGSARVLARPEYGRLVAALQERIHLQLFNELYTAGLNNGGVERIFDYAGLHGLVHDGVGAMRFRMLAGECDPEAIHTLISFGAQSEARFYAVRQLMQDSLGEFPGFRRLNTVQYLTSLSTPPYKMLAGGDLSLREVLVDPTLLYNLDVHTPVRQAIGLLVRDVGSVHELVRFFTNCRDELQLEGVI